MSLAALPILASMGEAQADAVRTAVKTTFTMT
jgi:hypothetical protein